MSTSRHSILFLSGAGLPAWIWDDVRDRLGASYTAQVAPRPEGGAAGLRDFFFFSTALTAAGWPASAARMVAWVASLGMSNCSSLLPW